MLEIQPMKAITVWQPWSSLLAIRDKIHETRSWATKYRGPIAIHAADKGITNVLNQSFPCWPWEYHPSHTALNQFLEAIKSTAKVDDPMEYMKTLPRGCIIAVADLVNCWQIQASKNDGPHYERYRKLISSRGLAIDTQLYEKDYLFGDWTPGRFAWEFSNMRMLQVPIPCKGRQGLWNWEGTAA